MAKDGKHDWQTRALEAEAKLAAAEAEIERLETINKTPIAGYERYQARIASLEAELASAAKGCFAGPDGGDCPWLNDHNAKRRGRPNAR
jgi:hypothetical protein